MSSVSSSSSSSSSSSQSIPTTRATSPPPAHSTGSFPDKQRREKCKHAREEYMKCLDHHYGVDAPSLDPENRCTPLFTLFESECPKIWVTHFLQKRETEIRNRKLGFTN
ncbi:hypothetical protein HMI54_015665 [Coelomomyces lativittatus]|nr:hypothetical protein HMI56_000975 [Coelomomyces lativittatus]KAJ1509617.1 hypothetical protein HMI55_007324 [Coelomomyces lativittatus]KAJ1512513.1 hypothetical protein HMI54_015665 [Coelomomyces lativittatus]